MEIGIFDIKGENQNPLSGEKYSENYKELAKTWSTYPVFQSADQIVKKINDNNVILIQSGTGSGKSVIVPKLLLHHFDYKKKVVMILPKQIIAKSGADYSAKVSDVTLGKEIGFKYRGESNYNETLTKLLYTTDGTLISMIMKDNLLNDYSGIIIDEAHERRTQTDFLLYLSRKICQERSDFRLIIMSATIDQIIFENYFKSLKFVQMNISGKSNYPIRSIYLERPIDKTKYVAVGIEKIKNILNETELNDIIFFVTSGGETFQACKEINKFAYCIEVFAGMNKDKEALAVSKDLFKTKSDKKRKVLIATNVAESSLTIDGIGYVVDSGYEYYSYFNVDIESKMMEKRMTSQSQIKQRMGRSGRTMGGVCYHLYTKQQYEKLDKYPKPSIQTSNIYAECLNLLNLPIVQTIDQLNTILTSFIEPPSEKYIMYSINKLKELELVKNKKITELGSIISQLPVDPAQGLSIYYGYKYGCAKEVIAIVVLSEIVKNKLSELFYKDNKNNKNNNDKKRKFDPNQNENLNAFKKQYDKINSDHYLLLKILHTYVKLSKNGDELNKWLNKYGLKQNVLAKAHKQYRKVKNDCFKVLQNLSMNSDSDSDSTVKFNKTRYKKKSLVLASLMHGYSVAHKKDNAYKTQFTNNASVDKDSVLIGKNKHHVLYTELFTIMGKTLMQLCSLVSTKTRELYENLK